MERPHEDEGNPPRLDALRRRLYAPGAGEADLERYRAERARLPAPPEEPVAPEPPESRRWRRTVLPAAALVLVGAVAVAVQRPAEPAPAATSATPSPVAALPLPAAVRHSLREDLAATRAPDLAQYLLTHPAARPAEVARATRAVVEEHYGIGPGSIGLSPDRAADGGGRMTVIVFTDRGDDLRWEATRIGVRPDHRQYRQVVADRDLHLAAGAPVSTTFEYDRPAPRALSVVVTQEVRWDVVVAYTD